MIDDTQEQFPSALERHDISRTPAGASVLKLFDFMQTMLRVRMNDNETLEKNFNVIKKMYDDLLAAVREKGWDWYPALGLLTSGLEDIEKAADAPARKDKDAMTWTRIR